MSQRATQGGNVFTSDNDIFNWADAQKFAQLYNLTFETFQNGASVLSKRITGITTGTGGVNPYYFHLSIPAGRELIIFDRSLALSQGRYFVDVVSTDGTISGGAESLKKPLRSLNQPTIQSVLRCGATVTGTITEQENGWVDTGTTIGAARAGGAVGVEGVLKGWTGETLLRVIKDDNANEFTANIRLIVWERDIP